MQGNVYCLVIFLKLGVVVDGWDQGETERGETGVNSHFQQVSVSEIFPKLETLHLSVLRLGLCSGTGKVCTQRSGWPLTLLLTCCVTLVKSLLLSGALVSQQ